MSLGDWVAESRERIRSNGLAGVSESLYQFYVGAWRSLGRYVNFGDSIFSESWDVLIVLDACRWDLMRDVEPNYEFLDDTVRYSCASSSEEWMRKTFADTDTSNVGYVTANPFSKQEIERNDFRFVDEVWEYAATDESGTIPAEAVTDSAIRAYRERSPDRLIVHYMQPHYPFVQSEMDQQLPLETFGDDDFDDVWDKLRHGELSREEVWKGYRANLEYVLNCVETLLNNVEGEVVITADHGNLLGEFGIYGHPDYVPIPALKRVPWCKTEGEDNGEYEVNDNEWSSASRDRDRLLEDLGYR